MANAKAYIIRYGHRQGVTVAVNITNPAQTFYDDSEIAKYFGISTRTYRNKLREYGAEQKSFKTFKKRYYLPDEDTAREFIKEYISSLIIADEMKRTQND